MKTTNKGIVKGTAKGIAGKINTNSRKRRIPRVALIIALVPALYACAPLSGSTSGTNNYNRNVANLNDEVVGLKQSVTELQIEVEQQRQFVDQLSNSQSIQDDLLINLNQRNNTLQNDNAGNVGLIPVAEETRTAPMDDMLNDSQAFNANTVALEPLQNAEADEVVSTIVVTPANAGFGPSAQPIIATEPQISTMVADGTASVAQPLLIVAQGELSRKDLYNRGYSEYSSKNYAMAISTFNSYINRYNDDLTDNAQYWIGESYYAEDNFDRAYAAFEMVGQKYPNSNKIPDALYKMAIIRNKQGDSNAARSIAEKLVQIYPATTAASYARQNIL